MIMFNAGGRPQVQNTADWNSGYLVEVLKLKMHMRMLSLLLQGAFLTEQLLPE